MIRYALTCGQGHASDSWFRSAAAFDALAQAGHLRCAVCGSSDVAKSLMAPQVAGAPRAAPDEDTKAQAIAKMRAEVETKATYVGGDFARLAREIHEGTAPDAAIYGEASAVEARALVEDGVPVLPLPFKPRQKMQ